jgi:hypothetical protein
MAKNKTLRDHAGDLAESLAPAVETARDKAAPLVSDARERVAPLLDEARDRVVPVFVSARDLAVPYLADARDVAAPYLADARDVAAPYVATARDKAAPYVSDARDRVSITFTSEVLPVVTAALAALDDATEDARHETVKRGRALAAALRGEIEAHADEPVVEAASESSHWLRTVLVALGLGGAGFAVVKRLNARQQTDSWQSSYTPPSSTTPAASTTPLADAAADSVADDAAASDPGEALADATDTPHVATTPDNPVTEVDVDRR